MDFIKKSIAAKLSIAIIVAMLVSSVFSTVYLMVNQNELMQSEGSKYVNLLSNSLKAKLEWSPVLNIELALSLTVEWYKAWFRKEDVFQISLRQIEEYYKN